MKIAIDATLLDDDNKFGIYNYQKNLIDTLAKIDKDNEYYLLFRSLRRGPNDMPGPNQSNFRKTVSRIPNGLSFDIYNRIWSDFAVPGLLKKHKIDVFHPLCTSFSTRKYSCKTVVTLHDLTHKFVERGKKPKHKYALESFERSIIKADRVLTDSNSTKKDLINFYSLPEERIHVTPLGIKPSCFHIPDSAQPASNIGSKIPAQFILYTGYFLPHKNIERIIRAFGIAKARNSIEHKLLFVGGRGFLRLAMEQLIEQLCLSNEVLIMDQVSDTDLNIIMNLADLLLFPTLYEGFGLPVIECMNVGTPVLTSNVSSLPEVAGEAAFIVDPTDTEQIANGIARILSDPALSEVLIKKGFARAKLFSWENTAYGTVKAYLS